jgi:hypothetical protein
MTKVAFVCLGSYNVRSWSKENNFARQSLYSIALEQMLSLAELKETKEKELDLHFYMVENTVSNQAEEVIEEFREQFINKRIRDVQYINNNSLGSQNKGAGEYTMCRAVIEKHREELLTYDWVVYYTLRQIVVSPLVLQSISEIRMNELNSSIIVGSPSSLYQDNKEVFPPTKNYCDMIFAMKPPLFIEYINSMSPEELIAKKMSSEANLYDFVNKEKAKDRLLVTERKRLGVLRYDYAINKTEIS